jgi:outer membrane immunogenic protein
MRRLALAGSVAAVLTTFGTAWAADMPFKAPAPAPAWSWSGCYVGLVGGYIGGRDGLSLGPTGTYLTPAAVPSPPNAAGSGLLAGDASLVSNSYRTSDSGGTVGFTSGCNWQFDRVVLGVDTDTNWSSLDQSIDASFAAIASVNPAFTIAPHVEHATSRLDFFSTYRGRAGFLANERLLVYATGGLAVGRFKSDTSVVFGPNPGPGLPVLAGAAHSGSDRSWRLGAVMGGGFEWAFADRWSLKAEYLYMTFQSFDYDSPLTAPAGVAPGYAWKTGVSPHEHLIRAGINYRFDLLGFLTGRGG